MFRTGDICGLISSDLECPLMSMSRDHDHKRKSYVCSCKKNYVNRLDHFSVKMLIHLYLYLTIYMCVYVCVFVCVCSMSVIVLLFFILT